MKRAWLYIGLTGTLLQVMVLAQKAPSGTAGDQPGGVPVLPAPSPGTVRISQPVLEHLVIKKVPPQYPEDARQKRVEGQVYVRAVIDKNGDVREVSLIAGHPLLAPSALEAVKQWKFKPYLLNHRHVEVETLISVNFQLPKH